MAVVTIADGSATAESPPLTGRLIDIQYVKHGTTPFADGVDFTITGKSSSRTLWAESNVNASAIRAPRQATHGTDGAAALYAAGGSAVMDHICLADEPVQIVIASGGDTKNGTFYITVA